jgi:hypothetical protein
MTLYCIPIKDPGTLTATILHYHTLLRKTRRHKNVIITIDLFVLANKCVSTLKFSYREMTCLFNNASPAWCNFSSALNPCYNILYKHRKFTNNVYSTIIPPHCSLVPHITGTTNSDVSVINCRQQKVLSNTEFDFSSSNELTNQATNKQTNKQTKQTTNQPTNKQVH